MNILKVVNGGKSIYLMREKPFDILNLMKGFSSEFKQDVIISSGAFSVNVPLFITYLMQFQDFVDINKTVTPLIIKTR